MKLLITSNTSRCRRCHDSKVVGGLG